jgi:hypothetical protein
MGCIKWWNIVLDHSLKLFKIFVCSKKDEFFYFFLDFCWMANFDHPLFIHFNPFLHNFFPHTHMHAFYLPQIFNGKWNTTSWSKFPKTCNFEYYFQLESINSIVANFHFSFKFHYFFTKTFNLKFFTTPSSQLPPPPPKDPNDMGVFWSVQITWVHTHAF